MIMLDALKFTYASRRLAGYLHDHDGGPELQCGFGNGGFDIFDDASFVLSEENVFVGGKHFILLFCGRIQLLHDIFF